MIISNLDTMEQIVKSRNDLIWEGWDVLKINKSPAAFFYKDGRRIKNAWYRTKRYPITREGWILTNDIIKA